MERILILIVLCFAFACSSGGGSSTAPNPNKPILSSLTFSPSTVNRRDSVTIYGEFMFTDMNGDLGGGYIYWEYENLIQNVALPDYFSGWTTGKGVFAFVVKISHTKGKIPVRVWLTDKAGNSSDKITVFINQL